MFEYELDNPMALYGSIPFMVAHAEDKTVGVLWLNAAETFIDVFDGSEVFTNSFIDLFWLFGLLFY